MNVKVYTFTVYREQIELIYLVVLEKNHFYCVAELSYKLNQAWNVI